MSQPIPLTTNTAEKDISGQETLINFYPKISDGKYPFKVVGTPGLAFVAELPTFPILGLHEFKGRSFAVTPTKLYEFFLDGTYVEKGTVDLQGDRVSIDDNGYQIVMVDGLKGYYFNNLDNTVSQITDADFYPAKTVTEQDGFLIFDRAGTNQFFISGNNEVTFDGTEFEVADGRPDNIVGVISSHRNLYVMKGQTIQPYFNSGNADFPFENWEGGFIEKGCAAPYTIAKYNNTVFFVGSDLIVYRIEGTQVVPISMSAVDQDLRGIELSTAFAYTYQDEGNLFYVLTIPERNKTWAYDITTGAWHIKEDINFGRHRASSSIYLDGRTLVGDFQSGRIFNMTRNTFIDDYDPIVRTMVLPTLTNDREFFSLDSFQLDMDVGIGRITGQGSVPKAEMSASKDNGKTYNTPAQKDIGKVGEYRKRVKWNRVGTGREFVIKVVISDPVPIEIGGGFIEAS